jgi:hypothetical protein
MAFSSVTATAGSLTIQPEKESAGVTRKSALIVMLASFCIAVTAILWLSVQKHWLEALP